jgi:hypothetical protein
MVDPSCCVGRKPEGRNAHSPQFCSTFIIWGVARGIGPEFKPQYHKKTKMKRIYGRALGPEVPVLPLAGE